MFKGSISRDFQTSYLCLISQRVSGMVKRHCQRSDMERFTMSTFLKTKICGVGHICPGQCGLGSRQPPLHPHRTHSFNHLVCPLCALNLCNFYNILQYIYMYNIVPVLNIYTHFLYCSLTVLKQTQPLVISVSYKKPVRMVLHSTQ